MCPEEESNLVLVGLVLDQIHYLRLLPISLEAFLQ
jgi:hypothetical protein